MINALLIDFDGVLRHWPDDHANNVEAEFGLPPWTIAGIAFAPELVDASVSGSVTDEAWRANVAERIGLAHSPVDGQAVVDAWSESSGEIDSSALRVIESCRPSITVTLVTNATSRLPWDLDRLGLSETFDHIVNSSQVGFMKPAADIFAHALRVSGASASTALFVDDKMENLKGAEQMGIASHLFESLEGLQSFLASHGVE